MTGQDDPSHHTVPKSLRFNELSRLSEGGSLLECPLFAPLKEPFARLVEPSAEGRGGRLVSPMRLSQELPRANPSQAQASSMKKTRAPRIGRTRDQEKDKQVFQFRIFSSGHPFSTG